jgi:hypothetical protein
VLFEGLPFAHFSVLHWSVSVLSVRSGALRRHNSFVRSHLADPM